MTSNSLAHDVDRATRAFAEATLAFEPRVRVVDEGRVMSLGDGIATISGLPGAASEELLRLDTGARALVLDLEPDRIRAIVLDDARNVRSGSRARATGRRASIEVGPELLGRVVDPLGRPLDGRAVSVRGTSMLLERPAPQIHQRAAVHHPLYTGTLAIDSMFPIGRGQRELIVGDEGTGKTSIALDALVRQAQSGVVGVYVAIGRRRAETWQAVHSLRAAGERWVVVSAPDDLSPGLRYLAPYAGCAIAEYFMERGEQALVVYDDLTSHAIAWRELALLMGRPPGREAFPGDVFYLHSRLLERATQLSSEYGGGSMTALPIARLESGRLSAYLPTNLVSITDGQIVLSQGLYAAGQLPAIDAGLSVSRVGGKAQPQAFRDLAGRLRLEYARFLELESFSRIGARLEESVHRRIERGRRIRALLRQPRLRPMNVFQEVVHLAFATEEEHFARVPMELVGDVASRLSGELAQREAVLAARVERDPRLDGGDRALLSTAIRALVDRMHPSLDRLSPPGAGAGGS